MRIPAISGIIDRRILANFRIEPEFVAKVLPKPFRPQIVNGYAVGGICLIRLKNVRPKFLPIPWGINSENAAHRFAVEWEEKGNMMKGVYIPRRDTSSKLNSIAGGRVFPGTHHHAKFTVHENEGRYSIKMESDDHTTKIYVSGNVTSEISSSSIFGSLATASQFFEQGSLGYSVTNTIGKFDGLELNCKNWDVKPLIIDEIHSSYFEDASIFPKGSIEFDCALLMQNIAHEWHGRPDICCS